MNTITLYRIVNVNSKGFHPAGKVFQTNLSMYFIYLLDQRPVLKYLVRCVF